MSMSAAAARSTRSPLARWARPSARWRAQVSAVENASAKASKNRSAKRSACHIRGNTNTGEEEPEDDHNFVEQEEEPSDLIAKATARSMRRYERFLLAAKTEAEETKAKHSANSPDSPDPLSQVGRSSRQEPRASAAGDGGAAITAAAAAAAAAPTRACARAASLAAAGIAGIRASEGTSAAPWSWLWLCCSSALA